MIKKHLILSALLVLASQRGFAAMMTYDVSTPTNPSQVKFFSKASVEDFEGTATQINGMFNVDLDAPDLKLSGTITVPVDSMETGLGMRDKHMLSRDWLNAEAYPTIRFDIAAVPASSVKKKNELQWTVQAVGTFTLKGVAKKITVPVTLKVDSPDRQRITVLSNFKVALKDFGIRGPLTMRVIGARVGNDVDVQVTLTGQSQKPWPKPSKKKK